MLLEPLENMTAVFLKGVTVTNPDLYPSINGFSGYQPFVELHFPIRYGTPLDSCPKETIDILFIHWDPLDFGI